MSTSTLLMFWFVITTMWGVVLYYNLRNNKVFKKDLAFVKTVFAIAADRVMDKVWEINLRGVRFTLKNWSKRMYTKVKTKVAKFKAGDASK